MLAQTTGYKGEVQDKATTKCSATYRAPELFEPPSEGVIGAGVDAWSLGCTLYAMAFGWSPLRRPRGSSGWRT